MKLLTPHTAEWFAALEACNSQQADMTRYAIGLAKRDDVCSVCGTAPASDYKVAGVQFSKDIGATIRLCNDCKGIRTGAGEKFEKLPA
jgi:hypothetical protein